MEFSSTISPTTLGTAFIVASALLGAYLALVRLRDSLAEKPDPKLTYSTIKQFNHLQQKLNQNYYENKKDLQNLRLETKTDLHRDIHNSQQALQALDLRVQKNAQKIASLAAQNQNANQRITELSIKTDILIQKVKK